MDAGSISKTVLGVKVGQKFTIQCALKRHLAPRTVGLILRALPLRANAHRLQEMVYVNTGVDSGVERPQEIFEAGDVAFLPAGGSICFFTGHYETKRPMGIIGKAQDSEMLAKIEAGDTIEIYTGA